MANDLGEYENKPIRKMAIEVRNTSGGLNAAVKVDPTPIHGGDTRFVVYEVEFDKFRFDPMDDGDAWCLVPIGTAKAAAFLDEKLVRKAIDDAKKAAIELADEKAGRSQLSPEMKLSTDHANGKHEKRRKKGCPDCYPEGEEGASVTTIGGGKRGRASASE